MIWGNQDFSHDFKVFHVHQLFFQLSQYLPKEEQFAKGQELLAADQLASDIYSYTMGIACPYHDKIDKPRFCSLNCVKRWAYLILDHCCPPLNLQRLQDSHIHIERPPHSKDKRRFKEEYYVILDSEKMSKIKVNEDQDLFGAQKTRAAPAGFVSLDMSSIVKNPKKMTPWDRKALEVRINRIMNKKQG